MQYDLISIGFSSISNDDGEIDEQNAQRAGRAYEQLAQLSSEGWEIKTSVVVARKVVYGDTVDTETVVTFYLQRPRKN